ncbi:hypothetical protein GW17_00039905, partial [Ensete ventricosum]
KFSSSLAHLWRPVAMRLWCPEVLWRCSTGVVPSRIKSSSEQRHFGREFRYNFM